MAYDKDMPSFFISGGRTFGTPTDPEDEGAAVLIQCCFSLHSGAPLHPDVQGAAAFPNHLNGAVHRFPCTASSLAHCTGKNCKGGAALPIPSFSG